MGRHRRRFGLTLAGVAAGLLVPAGVAVAAEESAPTPKGFVEYVEQPLPANMPFRLTGEVDLGVVGLPGGNRDSPNFRTYRVIEEGFVANQFSLGVETKDQRHYITFQGLDIGKNDQNYRASAGQYGRYRLDFEWDQIPHIYGQGQAPYARSPGGMYNLPGVITAPPGLADAATMATIFNGSTLFDVKRRNDSGKVGFWWTPTPGWDIQLNYENVRLAGNRPMGAGFGDPDEPSAIVVELPEPIQRSLNQVNATVGYANPTWQLQGGYRYSYLKNDIKFMTYDNPVFNNVALSAALTGLGVTDITTVPQGRTALAPSNQYQNFFLAGGVNLPMSTRLSAKVAYGLNSQNDTFTSYTINSALVGANPVLSTLYSPSLQGDVRTLLASATGTTRPIRDMTVTVNYRYFSRDNRTLSQTFPDTVVRDSIDTTQAQLGRTFDYQKQNVDLDVAYRLMRSLTLRVGSLWERWDRSITREVSQTDEYGFKVGLTYRPFSWLEATGRYLQTWKRINDYQPFNALASLYLPSDFYANYPGAQSNMLRKYDEAARNREKAELNLRVTPFKGLSLAAFGTYGQDHYPWSYLGLQQDQNWSAGANARYTPVEWLAFRASYTHQVGDQHMRSNSRPGPGEPQMPDFDWISQNVDTSDTIRAGAVIQIIPNRLELQASYALQRAVTRINSFNPVTPFNGTPDQIANASATSFPNDHMTLNQASAVLRYWLLKNLSLRLGYTYERFHVSYWQTDFIQPMNNPNIITGLAQPGGGTDPTVPYDVFLGLQPFKSYQANIIAGAITYGF